MFDRYIKKGLNITNHQGTTNQNQNKITLRIVSSTMKDISIIEIALLSLIVLLLLNAQLLPLK